MTDTYIEILPLSVTKHSGALCIAKSEFVRFYKCCKAASNQLSGACSKVEKL